MLLCVVIPFSALAKNEGPLHHELDQERKSLFAPIRKNPELKDELLNSVQFLPQDFYTTLLDDGTDVILVGEEHHDTTPLRDVNLMIEELADKGLTHVASEFLLSKEQPLLDQFARGEISYRELSEGCTLPKRSYVAVVAKRNNVQVIGLDLPAAHQDPAWAMTKEGMTIRNKAWTERILEIKSKNPHAKILLHGGSYHTQLMSKYFPTMPQLLKKHGLKVKVIEFVSAYDPVWDQIRLRGAFDLFFEIPKKLRQYVNADYIVYSPEKPFAKQVSADIEKAMKSIEQQHGGAIWENDSIYKACIFDPQNPVCRIRINNDRVSK